MRVLGKNIRPNQDCGVLPTAGCTKYASTPSGVSISTSAQPPPKPKRSLATYWPWLRFKLKPLNLRRLSLACSAKKVWNITFRIFFRSLITCLTPFMIRQIYPLSSGTRLATPSVRRPLDVGTSGVKRHNVKVNPVCIAHKFLKK